jgi:hypothetical protein
MIGNFEKWRAAPQVLRAPEGVESGFEAPKIHIEVMEFEEYFRRACVVIKATGFLPYNVEGHEDIPKLPSNHLAISVMEAVFVQSLTKDTRPAPGWERRKSDYRRVQLNEKTLHNIFDRLHKVVATAISVRNNETLTEIPSRGARQLSTTLHDKKATQLKIIGLLPSICNFAALDEVERKKRDAIDFDREYKESSVHDVGTESHQEGLEIRISNAREIMARLIEQELSLISRNTERFSILQAALGSASLREDANTVMQKEAAKFHGVTQDAIRKIKREFFLWSLLMASNKEGELISDRQHAAYIKNLRERPVGDRNKLYPAFNTVLKIEEILVSGPDITLLCEDLMEKSGLFPDDIFKKFWLDLRMPYTDAFLASPSVHIDDEETKELLCAYLARKAAAVKLL